MAAVFGDHWKAVDDNECVQAFLKFDFILFLEIYRSLLERGNSREKFLHAPEKSTSSSSSSWRSCSVRVSKLGAMMGDKRPQP